MNKSELVAVRPAVLEDKNFILATYLRGLYYGESWFSEIPKTVFMREYHSIIERLLASPNTQVVVACLKEDPEVLLGYAILSNRLPVCHWVFVKKAWRGIGIAKMLVPSETKSATHLTKVGLSIIRKKNIDFNPFLIS